MNTNTNTDMKLKAVASDALFGSSGLALHTVILGWTYVGWIKRNPKDPQPSWDARQRHKESDHGEARVCCVRTERDGWNCWTRETIPGEDCCDEHRPKYNPMCDDCCEASYAAFNLPNDQVLAQPGPTKTEEPK